MVAPCSQNAPAILAVSAQTWPPTEAFDSITAAPISLRNEALSLMSKSRVIRAPQKRTSPSIFTLRINTVSNCAPSALIAWPLVSSLRFNSVAPSHEKPPSTFAFVIHTQPKASNAPSSNRLPAISAPCSISASSSLSTARANFAPRASTSPSMRTPRSFAVSVSRPATPSGATSHKLSSPVISVSTATSRDIRLPANDTRASRAWLRSTSSGISHSTRLSAGSPSPEQSVRSKTPSIRAPLIRTPGVRIAQLGSSRSSSFRKNPARTMGFAPPGPPMAEKSAISPAFVRSTTKCSCGDRSLASNAMHDPPAPPSQEPLNHPARGQASRLI